jgi:hypothetical protein
VTCGNECARVRGSTRMFAVIVTRLVTQPWYGWPELVPSTGYFISRVYLQAGKVKQPRNGPNWPFRSTSVP